MYSYILYLIVILACILRRETQARKQGVIPQVSNQSSYNRAPVTWIIPLPACYKMSFRALKQTYPTHDKTTMNKASILNPTHDARKADLKSPNEHPAR